MAFSRYFPNQGLQVALVLSLAAAVSLGITRFAYGLLLPPMRADLGWSYALAGALNTANAAGYLMGALTAPWLLGRLTAPRVLIQATCLASFFMATSGLFTDASLLLVQRVLAGVASAWVFVAGGVMAARLGNWFPKQSGLLLGIFYGGVGWGIVLSAVLVPIILSRQAGGSHAWQWAWWYLALACAGMALVLIWPTRYFKTKEALSLEMNSSHAIEKTSVLPSDQVPGHTAVQPNGTLPLARLGHALAAYACFGVGYIGYMTFVIALLRDRGAADGQVTVFYALLGLAVVASSRLWAGLLDRAKGGGALATLNGLLGLATVLPAWTSHWPWMLVSGVAFGGVFLSVVASTTALVRHNLPTSQWAAGISLFTVVFAVGQIVGPFAVGWIADGEGGLARGLWVSACVLWLGAALATRQRPLIQR